MRCCDYGSRPVAQQYRQAIRREHGADLSRSAGNLCVCFRCADMVDRGGFRRWPIHFTVWAHKHAGTMYLAQPERLGWQIPTQKLPIPGHCPRVVTAMRSQVAAAPGPGAEAP